MSKDHRTAHLVLQFLFLLPTAAGIILYLVTEEANDKQFTFVMFTGVGVTLFLWICSLHSIPALLSLNAALLYFWIPKGIITVDDMMHQLDDIEDDDDKLEMQKNIISVALILGSNFGGILAHLLLKPDNRKFRAVQCLALLGIFLVIAGDVTVWTKIDRSSYAEREITFQALVAMLFTFDCMSSSNSMVIAVSLFMCALTACEAILTGIDVLDLEGDEMTIDRGFIAVGAGLGFLSLLCVATSTISSSTSVPA
jgi:hypothetical protein